MFKDKVEGVMMMKSKFLLLLNMMMVVMVMMMMMMMTTKIIMNVMTIAGLMRLTSTSRDWDELLWAWEGWRNVSGKEMKPLYIKMVLLLNKDVKATRQE